MYLYVYISTGGVESAYNICYGVASVSRIDTIIGLFCKRDLKETMFCKRDL